MHPKDVRVDRYEDGMKTEIILTHTPTGCQVKGGTQYSIEALRQYLWDLLAAKVDPK